MRQAQCDIYRCLQTLQCVIGIGSNEFFRSPKTPRDAGGGAHAACSGRYAGWREEGGRRTREGRKPRGGSITAVCTHARIHKTRAGWEGAGERNPRERMCNSIAWVLAIRICSVRDYKICVLLLLIIISIIVIVIINIVLCWYVLWPERNARSRQVCRGTGARAFISQTESIRNGRHNTVVAVRTSSFAHTSSCRTRVSTNNIREYTWPTRFERPQKSQKPQKSGTESTSAVCIYLHTVWRRVQRPRRLGSIVSGREPTGRNATDDGDNRKKWKAPRRVTTCRRAAVWRSSEISCLSSTTCSAISTDTSLRPTTTTGANGKHHTPTMTSVRLMPRSSQWRNTKMCPPPTQQKYKTDYEIIF